VDLIDFTRLLGCVAGLDSWTAAVVLGLPLRFVGPFGDPPGWLLRLLLQLTFTDPHDCVRLPGCARLTYSRLFGLFVYLRWLRWTVARLRSVPVGTFVPLR